MSTGESTADLTMEVVGAFFEDRSVSRMPSERNDKSGAASPGSATADKPKAAGTKRKASAKAPASDEPSPRKAKRFVAKMSASGW